MLALKDKNNICGATVPALAKIVGITTEETEQYLEKFQQPDKWSRSQEHEGRRIAPTEGGWLILNGEKYQEKLSAEKRREDVRVNVANCRARQAAKKAGKKPKIDKKGRTKGFNQPAPIHAFDCECSECEALNASGEKEAV